MDIRAGWVARPYESGGLDHLAAMAPCMNIYGRQLPGITNVTDRARYYSFYPWLIWALEQAGYDRYDDSFIQMFRRGDCLFTATAARHAAITGGDYRPHAVAMVGSATLYTPSAALEGSKTLTLSDYAVREASPTRYFQNILGGLGQYYLGVLAEMRILDGSVGQGVAYTRPLGENLARAMDAGVDRQRFIQALEADTLSAADLDTLSSFCPCALEHSQAEHDALRDLFFVRGDYYLEDHLPRRRSLQLILSIANLRAESADKLDDNTFRGVVYGCDAGDGRALHVPEHLQRNHRRWLSYVRQDLLSVAVQGLFFALLDAYQLAGQRAYSARELVAWYLNEPEGQDAVAALGDGDTVDGLLAASSEHLPALADWMNSDHECQLAESVCLASQARATATSRARIVADAMGVLLRLIARRDSDTEPFADLAFAPQYLAQYPINLAALHNHMRKTWGAMTPAQWLGWLLAEWGVNTHLRVALRKLRGQSTATFRLRPSELGYEVIEAPAAAHTTPRFHQSVRILHDIGAIKDQDGGRWRLSPFGQEMVEYTDA